MARYPELPNLQRLGEASRRRKQIEETLAKSIQQNWIDERPLWQKAIDILPGEQYRQPSQEQLSNLIRQRMPEDVASYQYQPVSYADEYKSIFEGGYLDALGKKNKPVVPDISQMQPLPQQPIQLPEIPQPSAQQTTPSTRSATGTPTIDVITSAVRKGTTSLVASFVKAGQMVYEAAARATELLTPDWLYTREKDLLYNALKNKVNDYDKQLKEIDDTVQKATAKQRIAYDIVSNVIPVGINAMFGVGAAGMAGRTAQTLAATKPATGVAQQAAQVGKQLFKPQMIPFGVSAFGSYANEAEKEGADYKQQLLYGTIGAVAEVATETPVVDDWLKFLDNAVDSLRNVGSKSLVQTGAWNTVKRYGAEGIRWVTQAAAISAKEAAQEAIVDPMAAAAKKAIYEPDTPIFDIRQMGTDAAMGFAISTILTALGLPATYMSRQSVETQMKEDKPVDADFVNATADLISSELQLKPLSDKTYKLKRIEIYSPEGELRTVISGQPMQATQTAETTLPQQPAMAAQAEQPPVTEMPRQPQTIETPPAQQISIAQNIPETPVPQVQPIETPPIAEEQAQAQPAPQANIPEIVIPEQPDITPEQAETVIGQPTQPKPKYRRETLTDLDAQVLSSGKPIEIAMLERDLGTKAVEELGDINDAEHLQKLVQQYDNLLLDSPKEEGIGKIADAVAIRRFKVNENIPDDVAYIRQRNVGGLPEGIIHVNAKQLERINNSISNFKQQSSQLKEQLGELKYLKRTPDSKLTKANLAKKKKANFTLIDELETQIDTIDKEVIPELQRQAREMERILGITNQSATGATEQPAEQEATPEQPAQPEQAEQQEQPEQSETPTKQKAENVKIYTEMPKGWRIIDGAMTAPRGYVWISNNKSLFSGEYQSALLKKEDKVKEPETPTKQKAEKVKEPETPTKQKAEKVKEPETPKTSSIESGDVISLPVDVINVDPDRFQFKMNTGATGTTALLKDVKTWDKYKAGVITVWLDNEGKYWVVNGHHRLQKAKELGVDKLNAMVLKENAGITDKQARAIGAMINIAEGRGTAIDAGKFFKDSGLSKEDLDKQGISLREGVAEKGLALSQLSNSIFNKVVHYQIPVEQAAIIGRELPNDDAAQKAVLDMINRHKKEINNSMLEEIIKEVKASAEGVSQTAQITLFGDAALKQTFAVEKAEILDYVKKQLRTRKNLFKNISSDVKASMLEDAGNVLNVESNIQEANLADIALFVVDKQSHAKGSPMSDMLNKLAVEYASSDNKLEIKRRAFDNVLNMIKSGKALEGIEYGQQTVLGINETSARDNAKNKEAATGQVRKENVSRPASGAETEAEGQVSFAKRPKPVSITENATSITVHPQAKKETKWVINTAPPPRATINRLMEVLDIPSRVGRIRNPRALGQYDRHYHVIRTKLAEDMPVIAHEVGHHIDNLLKLRDQVPADIVDELKGLGATQVSINSPKALTEGIAEFMRLYLTDTEYALRVAPKAFRYIDNMIFDKLPQIYDALTSFRNDYNAYMNAPAVARLMSKVSIGESTRKHTTVDDIMTATVDEYRPVDSFVQETMGEKRKDLPITLDPFKRIWLFRGWIGKAENMLKHNQYDADFNVVGPALREILRPVDGQLYNFRAYLIAKRAIELHNRKINPGIDIDTAKAALADVDSPLFEKTAQKLYKYQDNLLERYAKSGMLTSAQLKIIRDLNKMYVPFYRYMGDDTSTMEFAGETFVNVPQAVKKIMGSGRTIIDPLESIVKNTYYLLNLAERNIVGTTLADFAEKYEGTGKYVEAVRPKMKAFDMTVEEAAKGIEKAFKDAGIDVQSAVKDVSGELQKDGFDISEDILSQIITIFRPNMFGDPSEHVVRIYRKGIPTLYKLSPELYKAMMTMNRETSNLVVRLLSYPAKLLRAGTVYTPEFAARNPIRDAFSAFIFSEYGVVPGVDTVKGLFHAVKADKLYQYFLESGAATSTISSLNRNYLQENMYELFNKNLTSKERLGKTIKSPFLAMVGITNMAEVANRLPEFQKALAKEGMNEEGRMKAALAARDITIDFMRKGSSIGPVNQMVPFFNPAIQGMDKMRRSFKEHPARTTARAVISITIPSILLWALTHDDDRIKELPQWRKDMYWNIPLPSSPYIVSIPKPFEMGVLFGSFFERALDWINGEDPQAIKDWVGSLSEAMLPSWLPTAFLPIFENIANYNLFRKQPIVPESEEQLPAYAQYSPYTTETAKAIGKALAWMNGEGYSPRKIENFVRGYAGGLGIYALQGIDKLAEAAGLVEKPPGSSGIERAPLAKAFIVKAYQEPETVNRFYEELGYWEGQYQLAKKMSAVGKPNEYISPEQYAVLKEWRKISDQLSQARKLREQVIQAGQYTTDQKQQLIDAINADMINIARYALGMPLLEPNE